MAKPDLLGSIYRIKPTKTQPLAKHSAKPEAKLFTSVKAAAAALKGTDPLLKRRAVEWIAGSDGVMQDSKPEFTILDLLADKNLDAWLEHAAMSAVIRFGLPVRERFDQAKEPVLQRRLFKIASQQADCPQDWILSHAEKALLSSDASFRDLATATLCGHQYDAQRIESIVAQKSAEAVTNQDLREHLQTILSEHLKDAEFAGLVTQWLEGKAPLQHAALKAIAAQTSAVSNAAWLAPIGKALGEAKAGDLPLLLDAVKRLGSTQFDAQLQAIANDTKQPLSMRLHALGAMKGLKLTADTFGMLQHVLTAADSSAASRIQAATMLASAPLNKEQLASMAPVLASVGPLEMKSLLALINKCGKDTDLARTVSTELAKNPVIGSQQESTYRTIFSSQPPELFETIILPALRKANEVNDAKMRQLGPLAEKVMQHGDPKAGRAIYESGKSVCIACHQIGEKGRAIGPNLSHIGAIRTERDLLESIIFPSNTLARDYESHVIETSDGQSFMGVIKSHTAEGLLLVDAAGQEKSIPDSQIVANTTLTVSLMPMGLDQTLSQKELCDLVAWLRSLK
jgi:putative heme-binding domain-containing protein